MRPTKLFFFVAGTLLLNPAFAQQPDAVSQLDAIIAEHWEYRMREFPLEATQAGIPDFNDRFRGVTPADRERRMTAEQGFLRRTRDIDASRLDAADAVNAELFEWVLEDSRPGTHPVQYVLRLLHGRAEREQRCADEYRG
jgi:uncharacterized protein (DUF885 family)